MKMWENMQKNLLEYLNKRQSAKDTFNLSQISKVLLFIQL